MEFDYDQDFKYCASCSKATIMDGLRIETSDAINIVFHTLKHLDARNRFLPDIKDSHAVYKFLSYLLNFVIGNDLESLCQYYEHEGESMIACLFRCLAMRSKSVRISLLLNELANLDSRYLSSLYYFYFFLTASVNRLKIHKAAYFQRTISEWTGLNPQLLDFLNLYIQRGNQNLVETLYKL